MLKTCIECKRLFKGEGEVCSKCEEKIEDTRELGECLSCSVITINKVDGYCYKCAINRVDHFKIVKEYLYFNPKVSVKALSSATGVPVNEINAFVAENKIDVSEGAANGKKLCIDCGKEIDHGNMCMPCKRNREALDKIKSGSNVTKDVKKVKFFIKND